MDKKMMHQFIDETWDAWIRKASLTEFDKPTADAQTEPSTSTDEAVSEDETTPTKRAVRTKSSGDKVYMVDDETMTKRWISSPDVLKGLGFNLEDVTEIEDMELAKYRQSASA